jgi:hypothetical protein
VNRRRLFAVALLAAGLTVRLAYGLMHPPQAPGQDLADPDGYLGLATSFSHSWSLVDSSGKLTAVREPVYPIVLGLAVRTLGRNYGTVLALHGLLSTLSLVLMFVLGRRLFGEAVAFSALAVGAFYPPFIFYFSQPLRETLMVFLGLLGLWSVIKMNDDGGPLDFAAAGACSAIAGLTNTVLLPFGLAVPVVSWLFARNKARSLGRIACYLGIMIPLYALWPLRNHSVFGSWIMGSTAGAGPTFYLHLVIPEEIAGTPAQNDITERDPAISSAPKTMTPAERERYYWKAGIQRVREDPRAYARLLSWRLFRDWWRLAPRPRSYAHSFETLRWISLLSDGWIVPLGLLGLLVLGLRSRELFWGRLFVACASAPFILIVTMLRYRLSIMPVMIISACAVLHRAVALALKRP